MGGVIVNGEVLYVPTPKQAEYHSATAKNVLFYGGRGSGKSMCGRWDAHMRALSTPGFKYAILRRTFPELEKSHLIDLPAEAKKLGAFYNATSKRIHYPNGSVGFFSHCQNDNDALNLLSSEFYLMFFDEISTFDWDMFKKLAASVRVPAHMKDKGVKPMVKAATNPYGASAEMINKYWIEHDVDILEEDLLYKPKDWLSIQANLEDNPYLDREEYLAQFSGLSDHIRKAWVEGEFSIENALFDFRKTKNSRPYHVIQEFDYAKILPHATVYRTIDDGWFPDPTVVLWIAHLGSRHIVFHEMVKYKTPAEEMANLIKEEDKIIAARVGREFRLPVAMTYCDPTMNINTTADVRSIMEKYDANGVPMEPSINNREHFATSLHNILAEEAGEDIPRIQFYANPYNKKVGCPYLVRSIPQMRYDPNNTKKMADHKDDHAVVALCYYVLSYASLSRDNILHNSSLPRWMKPKKGFRRVLGSDNISDNRKT